MARRVSMRWDSVRQYRQVASLSSILNCGLSLWIVKSGLKYQTASFILNWMGDEHVPQIINSSKDWLIPGLKHYIIGYDMLVPKSRTIKKSGKVVNQGFDITQFDRVGIKCVVLDECQQIKNVDSYTHSDGPASSQGTVKSLHSQVHRGTIGEVNCSLCST